MNDLLVFFGAIAIAWLLAGLSAYAWAAANEISKIVMLGILMPFSFVFGMFAAQMVGSNPLLTFVAGIVIVAVGFVGTLAAGRRFRMTFRLQLE